MQDFADAVEKYKSAKEALLQELQQASLIANKSRNLHDSRDSEESLTCSNDRAFSIGSASRNSSIQMLQDDLFLRSIETNFLKNKTEDCTASCSLIKTERSERHKSKVDSVIGNQPGRVTVLPSDKQPALETQLFEQDSSYSVHSIGDRRSLFSSISSTCDKVNTDLIENEGKWEIHNVQKDKQERGVLQLVLDYTKTLQADSKITNEQLEERKRRNSWLSVTSPSSLNIRQNFFVDNMTDRSEYECNINKNRGSFFERDESLVDYRENLITAKNLQSDLEKNERNNEIFEKDEIIAVKGIENMVLREILFEHLQCRNQDVFQQLQDCVHQAVKTLLDSHELHIQRKIRQAQTDRLSKLQSNSNVSLTADNAQAPLLLWDERMSVNEYKVRRVVSTTSSSTSKQRVSPESSLENSSVRPPKLLLSSVVHQPLQQEWNISENISERHDSSSTQNEYSSNQQIQINNRNLQIPGHLLETSVPQKHFKMSVNAAPNIGDSYIFGSNSQQAFSAKSNLSSLTSSCPCSPFEGKEFAVSSSTTLSSSTNKPQTLRQLVSKLSHPIPVPTVTDSHLKEGNTSYLRDPIHTQSEIDKKNINLKLYR
eukprot:GHVL01022436.1.p1 GENE.GHVL01022436.1~~GHVL01022436.1.p1  ORF type:complete len:599 (-),score=76.37 GHVL01022436.1:796-2592(-)